MKGNRVFVAIAAIILTAAGLLATLANRNKYTCFHTVCTKNGILSVVLSACITTTSNGHQIFLQIDDGPLLTLYTCKNLSKKTYIG